MVRDYLETSIPVCSETNLVERNKAGGPEVRVLVLEAPVLPDAGEGLGITQQQMGSIKPRISTGIASPLDLSSSSASIFP